MQSQTTSWPDTINRLISALVIGGAFILIFAILHAAITFTPSDAKGLPLGHSVADVVTMVTGVGGLVTAIVGLFFGINVARQGLDAASQANTTANNIANAFQTQQTQTATMLGSVTGGLTALKSQIPSEQHAYVDDLIRQVRG